MTGISPAVNFCYGDTTSTFRGYNLARLKNLTLHVTAGPENLTIFTNTLIIHETYMRIVIGFCTVLAVHSKKIKNNL